MPSPVIRRHSPQHNNTPDERLCLLSHCLPASRCQLARTFIIEQLTQIINKSTTPSCLICLHPVLTDTCKHTKYVRVMLLACYFLKPVKLKCFIKQVFHQNILKKASMPILSIIITNPVNNRTNSNNAIAGFLHAHRINLVWFSNFVTLLFVTF